MLIALILFLKVHIIVKKDADGKLILRYKYAFWTFGEKPNPNSIIVKTIKSITGIDELKLTEIKKSIKEDGLSSALKETVFVIKTLLTEVLAILKHCTVSKFYFKVVCTDSDAALCSLKYGTVSAVLYPLAGFISENIKVKEKNYNLDISADFEAKDDFFDYNIILSVRVITAVIALLKIYCKRRKKIKQENR